MPDKSSIVTCSDSSVLIPAVYRDQLDSCVANSHSLKKIAVPGGNMFVRWNVKIIKCLLFCRFVLALSHCVGIKYVLDEGCSGGSSCVGLRVRRLSCILVTLKTADG